MILTYQQEKASVSTHLFRELFAHQGHDQRGLPHLGYEGEERRKKRKLLLGSNDHAAARNTMVTLSDSLQNVRIPRGRFCPKALNELLTLQGFAPSTLAPTSTHPSIQANSHAVSPRLAIGLFAFADVFTALGSVSPTGDKAANSMAEAHP